MFRRRKLHELMDEMDKFIEDMTKEVEEMVKNIYESTEKAIPRPVLYGFSLRLDSDGKPIIKTFGDKRPDSQHREPIFDQIVDENRGELRLFVELPGVNKEDVNIKSSEDDLQLTATGQDRKYMSEIKFKAAVEPSSASAVFKNGILEITFKLKDKTNKGFKSIRVD